MKKSTPENIDEIFKRKLSGYESEPFPESKEKIFMEFYRKQAGSKKEERNIFRNVWEGLASYRYQAAAVLLAALLLGSLFFFYSGKSTDTQMAVNNHLKEKKEISGQFPAVERNINRTTAPEVHIPSATQEGQSKAIIQPKKGTRSGTVQYKTEHERMVIFLPDSSKVFLNTYTSLSFEFTDTERKVDLSGEAYFDVKRMEQKPFIIKTAKSQVEVLGTSFNVRAFSGTAEEVIVESGKVLFMEKANRDKNRTILTIGMKAYLEENGKQIVRSSVQDPNDLAWKTNRLVFNGSPMHEVIKEVESYFGTKIYVDSKIYNCRFTGKFVEPSLEEVLETLSVSVDGSFEIKTNEYTLRGKGCN